MNVNTSIYKKVRFSDSNVNSDHFYSILDNLYLSDQIASFNEKLLEKNKIKHLINLTKSTPFLSKNTKNIYYSFLNDLNFTNEIICKINNLVNDLFVLLSKKENVLIFCENGSNQSLIILACFLMKYYDSENIINIDSILRFIKWKTKQTILKETPNYSLLEQYRAFLLNTNNNINGKKRKIELSEYKKQQKKGKIISIVRNHFS